MHFSDVNNERGSKVTKIAIVAVLHVLVGLGFVKTINSKMITMPKMPEEIMVLLQPEAPPPPPPAEPPKPMPKLAPPDIVMPKVEVDIPPPPPAEQVQATIQADAAPATPGPVTSEAPTAPSNTGAMRTAVLADANGCAKPE
jgi:protein TonB